jgi:hypothetical protein
VLLKRDLCPEEPEAEIGQRVAQERGCSRQAVAV